MGIEREIERTADGVILGDITVIIRHSQILLSLVVHYSGPYLYAVHQPFERATLHYEAFTLPTLHKSCANDMLYSGLLLCSPFIILEYKYNCFRIEYKGSTSR